MTRKASLLKLEIPECVTNVGKGTSTSTSTGSGNGLMTPFGTRWTVVGLHPSTPVSAIASTQPCLILPMIEVQAQMATQADARPDPSRTPLSAGGPRRLLPSRFADQRLHHDRHHHRHHLPKGGPASCPASRASRGSSIHFQRFREELWRHGSKAFGDALHADVFVRAVQLPRALSEEPMKRRGSSPCSSRSSAESSPAPSTPVLPPNGRLTVRAVLHSKTRCAAVGLAREFELEKLHATIPEEPLPSPSTPNFDREALFSALRWSDGSTRSRRSCSVDIKMEDAGESPLRLDQISDGAIPMHTPYARAQLPALAAIMMSDRVGRGDTIDLATPHPGAWSETVAYVYTGEAELLTDPVRDNILYLGGRV
ncbi:hypothetical protein ESCO_000521 [Escovopsis weberi]|uniref:Uncharacterized protein n=1 Tax=Escovopsis weberi TaxID=150374 RepID=A0A0M8N3D7_ESCWE|nr:hypothetical protein ESCO_000521 [Escovopsis weberi]